jgi:UDP-N-acetylmuramate--alanine ligase
MMVLSNYKHIYFIGIGGIGMSAIARYFNARGIKVSGYDKTRTTLTDTLVSEGMDIVFEDNVSLLSSDIDLVVFTPAVPKDHLQLNYLRDQGLPVFKRSQILGLISKNSYTVAVAGTHGKTTTSAFVAHMLKSNGMDISAFLGGILTGYETNYFLGSDKVVVVEADEYDRSFLQLSPTIASINAMDADHLDIYGDQETFTTSFYDFIMNTVDGGMVLIKHDLIEQFTSDQQKSITDKLKVLTFGFDKEADISIILHTNTQLGVTSFDITCNGKLDNRYISDFTTGMPGMHNVSNATVAIAVGIILGLDDNQLKSGISSFKGVKRRFEKIVESDITYIDDYAHHPEEIKSVCKAIRSNYPRKSILAVFQPHLYSRTRDFVDGFAEALDGFDKVLIMDIYPARELPIEGVTSKIILDKMKSSNVRITQEAEILHEIAKKEYDLILTIGAGNIDTIVPKIKNLLN